VKDNLPHLKRQMKRLEITQDRVASVARVHRTMVNKVINGRAKSKDVLATIRGLIAAEQEMAKV
jgi:hypothetical protein